jgi:hypothetical protein
MQGLASQGGRSADRRTALLYLFFLIFIVVEEIASAEATKGLCGRPLETFALHSHAAWFLSLQGEIASAEATMTNGFFVRCKCKFRRFTGGKSRNLHAADGGKDIARHAAELCGGALVSVLELRPCILTDSAAASKSP